MRIVLGFGVLMVILLAATVQADDDKEKKISVPECPKAVQKTLMKEVAKGKLIDVDVREVKGVAIYESEVWYGGLEYDIIVRGDGVLLAKHIERDGKDEDSDEGDEDEDGEDEAGDEDEGDDDVDEKEVETPVKMTDLPKSVQRTLKREGRGGQIEEIQKEIEDGKVVFEAEVEYETKDCELKYDIEIAEDGTLLSKVLEEAENDDEQDDEEIDDDAEEDDEEHNEDDD